MSDANTITATEKIRRDSAILGVFVFSILGISISGMYFVGAFLCVALAALHRRKSILIYAAFCAGFVAMIGAYQVGKDMAQRDGLAHSSGSCQSVLQPRSGGLF